MAQFPMITIKLIKPVDEQAQCVFCIQGFPEQLKGLLGFRERERQVRSPAFSILAVIPSRWEDLGYEISTLFQNLPQDCPVQAFDRFLELGTRNPKKETREDQPPAGCPRPSLEFLSIVGVLGK